ncbi:MAG TPA: hypothetical protein PLZ43_08135 [bacterium]|nr:hypothetical protein [bacterium]
MRNTKAPVTAKELFYSMAKRDKTEEEQRDADLLQRTFLAQYQARLNLADQNMSNYYETVLAARDAFAQKLPQDIIDKTSEQNKETGNATSYLTASALMHPAFTITAKKTIESFSALPFRFDISANDAMGVAQKKVIDKKLKTIYTRQNVTAEMFNGYFYNVINGLSISQVKTHKKQVRVTKPEIDEATGMFKEETLSDDRVISIMCYDPLNTVLDYSAKPSNITETSEFIVITDRYITNGDMNDYFGESNKMFDIHKRNLACDRGIVYDKFAPIREYYDRSGFFVTIAGDNKIIKVEMVSNGTVGKIPINVAPIWTDPDSPSGSTTLWNYMKNMVALSSRALNLVCDNVALNNNAPFFTYTGSGLEDNATLDNFTPREIVALNPIAGKSADIRNQIFKPVFQEITQGSSMMYEQGQQLAFMLAGTSPIQFGVQDKQIRVSGAADMISSATVRPDSDVARKMEVGFMNPTTWDIIQIFYIYYNDFGFDEKELPREFLKELKHVRVVPGSYLPEDAMTRLQRAYAVALRSQTAPDAYVQKEVEEEILDALGVVMPEQVLKSGDDILKQQTAFLLFQQFLAQAAQQLGIGALDNPQVDAITQKLGANVDGSYKGERQ